MVYNNSLWINLRVGSRASNDHNERSGNREGIKDRPSGESGNKPTKAGRRIHELHRKKCNLEKHM